MMASDAQHFIFSLGVVSYLNAVPLIDGLGTDPRLHLVPDVPSRLLAHLTSGNVDLALCPVIDYQTSREPLEIVPAGGICSDGPTLTVRVFSRIPIADIETIAVDGDSHTSAALLQILFWKRYGRRLTLVALDETACSGAAVACLLIGDKVITRQPNIRDYPYELDLGEAWKDLTGLPFVFAVWMARAGTNTGPLPGILSKTLEENLHNVPALATKSAREAGWPPTLAARYLGDILSYRIGARERAAIELFWKASFELGLIATLRPWHQPSGTASAA